MSASIARDLGERRRSAETASRPVEVILAGYAQQLRMGHNGGHRLAPPLGGWESRSCDRADRPGGGQSIRQGHVSANCRTDDAGQSDRSRLSPKWQSQRWQSHASPRLAHKAEHAQGRHIAERPRQDHPAGRMSAGTSPGWTNAAGTLAGATALEGARLPEPATIVETSESHSPFIYDDLAGTAEIAHSNECTSA